MKRILVVGLLLMLSVSLMAGNAFAAASVSEEDGMIWMEDEDSNSQTPEGLAARQLYCLGLFRGTAVTEKSYGYSSVEFSLENSMTRQQAIIMLVRLLGKEAEALAGSWELPFSDVAAGAVPYVGYAYANGLTNGITATSFGGANPVTANQYLTFVLRALGYSDAEGDFTLSESAVLAEKVGILSPCLTLEQFQRGDAALISNDALYAAMKGTDTTLLEKLQSEGAAERRMTIYFDDYSPVVLQGGEHLTEQMRYCRERFGDTNYLVQFPADTEAADAARWLSAAEEATGGAVASTSRELYNALEAVGKLEFYESYLERLKGAHESETEEKVDIVTGGVTISIGGGTTFQPADGAELLEDFIAIFKECGCPLDFEVEYEQMDAVTRYVENNLLETIEGTYSEEVYLKDQKEAYTILYDLYRDTVKEDMSDYEKIRALYNALAGEVSYHHQASTLHEKYLEEDHVPYEFYEEYGYVYSLVGVTKGKLVCEGYAKAMESLLAMADIENVYIAGDGYNTVVGHAWNKVKLNGNWYNLDLTWDDNGSSAGTKHFLKSDASFRGDGHGKYLDVTNSYDYPAPENYRP